MQKSQESRLNAEDAGSRHHRAWDRKQKAHGSDLDRNEKLPWSPCPFSIDAMRKMLEILSPTWLDVSESKGNQPP